MSTVNLARLEDDIAASRERLAATIDELVVRTAPRNVLDRTKTDLQQRFIAATHTDDGQIRQELVVALGAAATGYLLLRVLRRRRR